MRSFAIILAAGALCGCHTSPPTNFFTLDAVPPRGGPVRSVAGAPLAVDVVHISPQLDRLSMVREAGPGQLKIDDQDRWGAALGDLARNALAQDLAARLPAGMVVLPDAPAPHGMRTLAVDIAAFQPDASGKTVLDASWSLLQGNPAQPVLRRHARLEDSKPVTDAAAQAVAMSRLLGRLADTVARALAQPPAAQPNSAVSP